MEKLLVLQEGQSIFSAKDLLKTEPHLMSDQDVVLAYAFLSKFENKMLKKRIKELREYLLPLTKNKGAKYDNDYVLGENEVEIHNNARKGKIKYSVDSLKAVLAKKQKLEWWCLKQDVHNIKFVDTEIVETINEDGIRDALAHGLLDMEDIPKFTEIEEGTRVLNVIVPEDFDKMFNLEE